MCLLWFRLRGEGGVGEAVGNLSWALLYLWSLVSPVSVSLYIDRVHIPGDFPFSFRIFA